MAQIDDDHSDVAVARLFGRCLVLAARKLGIEHENVRLDVLCERIIMAAQRGGLDPASYRLAWTLLRPHGPH